MTAAKVDQAARLKARARRIALDKDRAARDAQIEAAAARVFASAAARARAEAEAGRAEDAMGAALRELLEAGLGVPQVAELCELAAGQVRTLAKRAGADHRTAPTGRGATDGGRSSAGGAEVTAADADAEPVSA